MSLDPDREPITRPVFVWLEIAARLTRHGDGGLAAAIGRAMDGRQLGDNAIFALTVDEQRRVTAVLEDWLGEHDPDSTGRVGRYAWCGPLVGGSARATLAPILHPASATAAIWSPARHGGSGPGHEHASGRTTGRWQHLGATRRSKFWPGMGSMSRMAVQTRTR
jgi:hypothetical protein